MNEIAQEQAGNISEVETLMDLPIDKSFLFSNHKGIYKKGVEKKQTRLFKKIGFIKPFLKNDEKILLVTTGCSSTSIIEQLTTGWVFYYIKRSLFIFTNKRIFHVPTTTGYKYRNSIAQINYSDCETVAMRGSVLFAKYLNGKKEKFLAMRYSERKKLKLFLKEIPFATQKSVGAVETSGKSHLCPRCAGKLETDIFTCSQCGLEFKSKKTAMLLSIILPGGGYFYTGHLLLGLGDAMLELMFMLLIVSGLADIISGNIEEGIATAVIIFIILAFEKMITVYHANHYIKEFIPKGRPLRPLFSSEYSQS